MSEHRFYYTPPLICPLCSFALIASQRKAQLDGMKLVHPKNHCVRGGKVYYAPGQTLSEIPEEFQ